MSDSKGLVVTVRIPNDVLRGRIDQQVNKRKVEYPKYSLNDFFLEAVREKLDGPPPPVYQTTNEVRFDVEDRHLGHGPTLQPGQFKESFWSKWSRDSKRLDGEAKQSSFAEALRERQEAGLKVPGNFMKMSVDARLAWLRVNDTEDEW